MIQVLNTLHKLHKKPPSWTVNFLRKIFDLNSLSVATLIFLLYDNISGMIWHRNSQKWKMHVDGQQSLSLKDNQRPKAGREVRFLEMFSVNSCRSGNLKHGWSGSTHVAKHKENNSFSTVTTFPSMQRNKREAAIDEDAAVTVYRTQYCMRVYKGIRLTEVLSS